VRTGQAFGLRAVRVPSEPPAVIAACGTSGVLADRLLFRWTDLLRYQAQSAGMVVNDHCFGLAWSGHMTADRLQLLAQNLPDGVSEIYLHPASGRDAVLDRLMPAYQHEAELKALLDPAVRAAFEAAGAVAVDYATLS
jgi:hypothetical protein